MMKLINVSKYFMTPIGRHYLFRNVDLELPLDRNVGVIGPNGAGKSTFLRLLGGADTPSSGTIVKSGRISPPMGLTPGLQSSLSARENVRFAGRIYGLEKPEIDEMMNYVRDLARIGHYFDMPVHTYSAGMKQRVAFGINMSMHFDYYLFDEISAGGDREFRKTAKAMVAERLRTSRFIMTSHDIGELLELCNAGIVIKDGALTYFDDIKDAARFYGEDDSVGKQKKAKSRLQKSDTEGKDDKLRTKARSRRTARKRHNHKNKAGRANAKSLSIHEEAIPHELRSVPNGRHPGERPRARRGSQGKMSKDGSIPKTRSGIATARTIVTPRTSRGT